MDASMMDFELWKQRREEMLREVERNRLKRAVRVALKRRAGRTSLLAWELQRNGTRLLKLLRTIKTSLKG